MALDESAASALREALSTGAGTDLVRELAEWALLHLIEVEATDCVTPRRSAELGAATVSARCCRASRS